MTTAPAFWDRIAPKYADQPIKNLPAYEATLDRCRHHLNAGDRVLEIGCGTGGTALALAPSVAEYVATDISPRMIGIGREQAWDASLRNLAFAVANPGSGDLPEGPFDAVLAFNLLHLLPDLPAALREVASRLKPGGVFISKTPCIGPMSPLRPAIKLMQIAGKAPFVGYMKSQALQTLITDAGFDILEANRIHDSDKRPFIVARRR